MDVFEKKSSAEIFKGINLAENKICRKLENEENLDIIDATTFETLRECLKDIKLTPNQTRCFSS